MAAMSHYSRVLKVVIDAPPDLHDQRLDSGAPRVHLDIHTDDLDAEVARLERLGADRVQKVQTWWVMRDPAGLLFCVLPVSPGSLNEENAQRWECS